MSEEVKNTEEEVKITITKAEESPHAGGDGPEEVSPEQKLIQELRGKAEAAEERARNAERERDSERSEKQKARTEATTAAERQIQAQEESIKSNLGNAKSEFEAAQREFQDAYDSGKPQSILEAQIKLNDAQNRLRASEYQEETFKVWKENRSKAPAKNEVSSASRFTKAEQEWIDAHPKFNTDRRYRAAVYAADEEAREKGIEIDSPAYFKHLEDYVADLGLDKDPPKKDEKKDTVEERIEKEPKEKDGKRASSTAAPVGVSTGSTTGGKKNTITMTAEMREAAAICYPDLYKKDPKAAEEKYAARQLDIAELKRQGKI